MPEDEPPAAEPGAGSEPADGPAWSDRVAPAKLGRVPHFPRESDAFEHQAQSRPAQVPLASPVPGAASPVARRTRARPGASPWLGLRRLLPWTGLILFGGCLYGLLSSSHWPAAPPAPPDDAGRGGGVVVVIDPGHGGADSGAVAQGVVEKDLNLDVGLRVARVLETDGLTVKLTRADDHFVPLETRVEMANAWPGAIFVSIHFNDAQGEGGRAISQASGIETYYSGFKQASPVPAPVWTTLFHGAKAAENPALADPVRAGAILADTIQHALIANTSATDRGIKEAGLYVTRRVRGPAVLVEGGFVSHPQEAHLLEDPAYRQRIANSIAEGIIKFLQQAQPGPGSSPPPPA